MSLKLLRSAFGAAPPRERAPRHAREGELLVLRGMTALLETGRGGDGDRVQKKLASALGRGVSLAYPGATHTLRDFDVIQFGPEGEKLTWLPPGHPGTPQQPQEAP
ncbi:MAG: hypothetical protein IT572_02555 [Deltaproteobacteria bacterium]|nr:hypothetical protein [Deltaproteobacteria bacterium]